MMLWCRFLTAPGCIKRGIRGAKPGVPHRRRHTATSVTSADSMLSFDRLLMSTASLYSSSPSSMDSCNVTSFDDVTPPTMPSPLPLSYLLVDRVVCWWTCVVCHVWHWQQHHGSVSTWLMYVKFFVTTELSCGIHSNETGLVVRYTVTNLVSLWCK